MQILQPAVVPPTGLSFYCSAYDTNGHRLLALDLWTGALFAAPSGTATWTQLPSVAGAPSRRSSPLFVYDSNRRRLVVFGGLSLQTLGDTWEFDGSNWTQIVTPTAPSARFGAAGCFRPDTGETILCCGEVVQGGITTSLGDTWAYDGRTWRQIASGGLTQLSSVALAADPHRGTVVAYSGVATHELGAAGWNTALPVASPPARQFPGLAYDPERRRCVSFGGLDAATGSQLADFWEYDGTTWLQRNPIPMPFTARARYGAQMHYDPDVRAVLVVAGTRLSGNVFRQVAEVMLYEPTVHASSATFAVGCPALLGRPELSAPELPWLGRTVSLRMTLPPASPAFFVAGLSNQFQGTQPLPAPLDAYGIEGCRQLVSTLITGTTVADSLGLATFPVSIPNSPMLLGVPWFAQALAPGTGTSSGFVATDGLRFVTGSF